MNLAERKIVAESAIIGVLKTIYDPEVPVNIYEMGLIYDILIDDDFRVNVVMTLTAPNCPVAESLPQEVKETVMKVEGVKDVSVEIVFDPPWTMEMMSDEAKLELGFY
jgi:FeS assembly SUF system protein